MKNNITVKRPLFTFCAVFFATGILTAGSSSRFKFQIILTCALSAAFAVLLSAVPKARRFSICALLLILLPIAVQSSLQMLTCDHALERANSFDGVSAEATLTITDTRYSSSYYGYYTARLTDSEVFPDMTVSLGFPDGSCKDGDVLKGTVTLESLDGSSSFDEETYFIPDGILMCASAEKLELTGLDSSFSASRLFSALNRYLTARIRAASGGGELASAVLLGRRELLESSVKRDFGRIGISHLLAVSGIHLSVIISAIEGLLDRCNVRKSKRALTVSSAVVFYMALVGFTPSVTRAGLVHLIRQIGQLVNRRSDSKTNLGTAAVIIMTADPFAVYDTGFILSVLAYYACVVYSVLIKDRKRAKTKLYNFIRSVADTVKLTLLITALTLPVMWKVFGEVSVISPLTNVVFIPAVTLFLLFSVIYVIFCSVPVICPVLTFLLLSAEGLIAKCARALSLLENVTVSLEWAGTGICTAALFIAVFAAVNVPKKRRPWRILAASSAVLCSAVLVLCISVGYLTAAKSAECVYVTGGKSEGFAIRCGNEYVLIDVSDGSSGYSRELTFAAEKRGAVEISELVLTHLHRRHIASVASLADYTVLRHAYIPAPETDADEDIAEALRAVFESRSVPYTEYPRNDTELSLGRVSFSSHGYAQLSRSTHPVVAFSFDVAERSYVYLGSSFEEGYNFEAETATADVVFFGAHPPVRKKLTELAVGGKAVLSQRANEKELLFIDAAKGTVTLAEDGSYSTGKFSR